MCCLLVYSSITLLAVKGKCNTIYVVPDEARAHLQCPSIDCVSFRSLTNNYSLESNSTIVLLPGTHVVNVKNDSKVYIKDVDSVSLMGWNAFNSNASEDIGDKNDAIILCQSSFAFVVINVTNFTLSAIRMQKCASIMMFRKNQKYISLNASLIVSVSERVTLDRVVITSTEGIAVSFYESNLVLLTDISVSHSSRWFMWVEKSNVTIEGKNLFFSNKGGLKVLNSSHLTLGVNSTVSFFNNYCGKSYEQTVYETTCSICYITINSKLLILSSSHITF